MFVPPRPHQASLVSSAIQLTLLLLENYLAPLWALLSPDYIINLVLLKLPFICSICQYIPTITSEEIGESLFCKEPAKEIRKALMQVQKKKICKAIKSN